jgi:hypothetical protein
LTGADPATLDSFFAELAPLHAELLGAVSDLPSAGAMMQAPLLYLLVRAGRPKQVVETGVSSGFSARLILEALQRNGEGRLWSIGIEKLGIGTIDAAARATVQSRPVGWLVPERLRPRWQLRIGMSEDLLPRVLELEARPLDLFVHDSLHHYDRMTEEYNLAWPRLAPGGWLLSHDIHNNRAWPDLLAREHLVGDEELDRDLGAVRKVAAAGPPTAPRTASG